ncbi:ImmA/IrrE family metallo-endopeptidase [Mesorhizobium sp. YM1C-6-2]|uniref:ImmA/IrrE family metallo-endopeptidase n=1 Tax=Mesorhizobium sp. YM1C-6-2 TaxID=1827501 RepID=UPI000EF286E3|nr:ImmA/IrrE family metallo-endopeptidase [Mesorhizobium sp. YM1C-6-2]RLP24019.1 ImmA/IrrE family metallo-endopeptidase [Mesorhizobium sp. YM1C-6-2]
MPLPDLDRMAVDDVALSVDRIASEMHRQLGNIAAPVPVDQIALRLGIDEIRERPLREFEAVLVTDPERSSGSILLNSRSSPYRRRYSLAHELGHFLCGWHKQTSRKGFVCNKRDMAIPSGNDVHVRQETEANQFAIELLAPKRLISRYLNRLPDLEHVLAMHAALEISKTAAARRYVNSHRERLAVIFGYEGCYQYADRGIGFPYIGLHKGDPLPPLPNVGRDSSISDVEEADPLDWPGLQRAKVLAIQVMRQENGHSIILLQIEADDPNDDD